MLQPSISEHQWVELPQALRNKLVLLFDIPKTGGVTIYANKVQSDGHTHRDLQAITVEKMKLYLGKGYEDDNNYFDLLENVIQKLNIDETTLVEKEEKRVETENVAKWLMTIRDIKKQATDLGLLDKFTELLQEFYPAPQPAPQPAQRPAPLKQKKN